MTRRHFQLIADSLAAVRPDADTGNPARDRAAHHQWTTTVLRFAYDLAQTNPRFDRDRFIHACGVIS